MFRSDIEQGILEALGRFQSLDFEGLVHQVLNRDSNWSEANETVMRGLLAKLRAEGKIVSAEGIYGAHMLAPAMNRVKQEA